MAQTINIDEYVVQQSKIIEQMRESDKMAFESKKQYILRLKEVTKPLVLIGYYDGKKLPDLCSIISDILVKNQITYSDGHLYELFEDDEKRSTTPLGGEKNSSPLPIEQRTGIETIDKLKKFQRDGYEEPNTEFSKHLRLVMEIDKERIKQTASIIQKLGHATAFVNAFEKIYESDEQIKKEIEHATRNKQKELQNLYDYYLKCKHTIINIESQLDVKTQKEVKEYLAELKHTSKQLDERNKITFIEKWNSILCCKLDQTKSHIAKLLGIDKKHLTNNVMPNRNPVTDAQNRHHDYISWFRAIKVKSPDGQEFTFDAKDYFDKQIERGRLQLSFEPLVLVNSVVK